MKQFPHGRPPLARQISLVWSFIWLLGLLLRGLGDMHAHQPGNQDGDIELTDDGLQEGEVARRRGNGSDISVTQRGLGDKTVVYEIGSL